MTKISVIIPTFNEEKYISECLNSIINQTFNNYEIIIVDSYSQDNTVKIARKYADKIIECDRKGPGFARNKGAKIAKGDILVFLDADTIANPDFLECYNDAFRKKSVVGATGPVITTHPSCFVRFFLNVIYNQIVNLLNSFGISLFNGCNSAYRKKEFIKIGMFQEIDFICEDSLLSRNIIKLGKTLFVKKAIIHTSHRRYEREAGLKAFLYYSIATSYVGITGRTFPYKYKSLNI